MSQMLAGTQNYMALSSVTGSNNFMHLLILQNIS
mgnify:CR=1 FL=1